MSFTNSVLTLQEFFVRNSLSFLLLPPPPLLLPPLLPLFFFSLYFHFELTFLMVTKNDLKFGIYLISLSFFIF